MLSESHPSKVLKTRDPELSLGSSPAFATYYVPTDTWDLMCLVNYLTCLCLSFLTCEMRKLCCLSGLLLGTGWVSEYRAQCKAACPSAAARVAPLPLVLLCIYVAYNNSTGMLIKCAFSNLLTDLSLPPGFESIAGRDLVFFTFSFSVNITSPTFIVSVISVCGIYAGYEWDNLSQESW